jgi:hypothetical protein
MESNIARLGVVIAAVAAIVVLFIVFSGDDSDETGTGPAATVARDNGGGANKRGGGIQPATGIPTIEIEDGQPVGGIQDLSFTSGDRIQFKVSSDQDWEIHFHGYDVMMDVTPDKPVTFDVAADIEGIFEVEIEDTATQIAEITVNPG